MKRPTHPTGDLSATARILRAVTRPTQVIRRADLRAAERPPEGTDHLSGILLVTATVASLTGLVVAFLGVLLNNLSIMLLGFILLSAGMACASLEGLLEPETELMARIRKVINR